MAGGDCGLETLEHRRHVGGLCCLHKLHWESTPDELKNIRPRPKTEGPKRFTRSRLYEGHDFLPQSDVRPCSIECYRRLFHRHILRHGMRFLYMLWARIYTRRSCMPSRFMSTRNAGDGQQSDTMKPNGGAFEFPVR